jgi:sec-independent protein translocase protein TatA
MRRFVMLASILGPQEVIILLVIGVVLFGKKLPEVGRSLGKALMELKRGLAGLEEEVQGVSLTPAVDNHYNAARTPSRIEAVAPKLQEDSGLALPSV